MCNKTENICESCTHYSALKDPREVQSGVYIYGYCFKYGTKPHNFGMGKGFPVYIKDAAICKDFKKKRERKDE